MVRRCERECVCLSLCVGPAVSWRLVQGVALPAKTAVIGSSRDKWWSKTNGWMFTFCYLRLELCPKSNASISIIKWTTFIVRRIHFDTGIWVFAGSYNGFIIATFSLSSTAFDSELQTDVTRKPDAHDNIKTWLKLAITRNVKYLLQKYNDLGHADRFKRRMVRETAPLLGSDN